MTRSNEVKRTPKRKAAETETPKPSRDISNVEIARAYNALDDALTYFWPKRLFMAIENFSDDVEVIGAAVLATGDHDPWGWGGPTVVIAKARAKEGLREEKSTQTAWWPSSRGKEPRAEQVVVSGRDALEQLRAAIDCALGDARRARSGP